MLGGHSLHNRCPFNHQIYNQWVISMLKMMVGVKHCQTRTKLFNAVLLYGHDDSEIRIELFTVYRIEPWTLALIKKFIKNETQYSMIPSLIVK